MRKRIYEIIEVAREGDRLSNVYDVFMMVVISLSLLPLMFKESSSLLIIRFNTILVMLRTIQFHHQLCLMAIKIDDVVSDRLLPLKAHWIAS